MAQHSTSSGVDKPAVGVHRNGPFVRLWAGQSVSEFGSQITQLALPLTAIQVLQANPQQIGYINAALYAPVIVLVLFAGVWVSGRRCLPLMMASNSCRAALLAVAGLLGVTGHLRIEYLIVLAALIGSMSVVFDVGYQTLVPQIVDGRQLIEANSRLQSTYSAARASGPALGGATIQWLSAPGALILDAVSFAVSVASLATVHRWRRPAEPDAGDEVRQSIVRKVSDGLAFMVRQPYLRALAVQAAIWNFFIASIQALYVYFATTDLGLSPLQIGISSGAGALGSLAVSLWARRLAVRLGVGVTIVGATLAASWAPLILPLAYGPDAVLVLLLACSFFISGMGATMSNIQSVSLRQAVTGSHMLGRVNASHRFVAGGALPLGALAGGALGSTIGAREALLVSAVALGLASLTFLATPVRRLVTLPDTPDESKSRP